MSELTHGVEAEVNGMTGFSLGVEPLGVEALEERVTPLFLALGLGAVVGTSCCHSSSS